MSDSSHERPTVPPFPNGSEHGTAEIEHLTTVQFPSDAPAPTRYCLDERPFASGAMGEVFEAHDCVLNRRVAVKTLKLPYADHPAAVQMFREEAQITGQLQHPAIPPIHDLGTLPDGRPFLVMKLIKGQTLDAILKRRPNPAHERPWFLHVFEQICQAVGFAHERNVIHRDLKPSNVMVGSFGEVQVMDWGLAKVLAGGAGGGAALTEPEGHLTRIETGDPHDATHAGALKGTLAFMPPEQARGEVHLIDRRSDVFALGAILCVVLTGKPPYTGTSPAEVELGERAGLRGAELVKMAARMGLLDGAFARLEACGADAELTALAKRCLASDRGERPTDGMAVTELVAAYRAKVQASLKAADAARVADEARAAAEANTRREAEARADAERARSSEQRHKRRWQLTTAAAVGVLAVGAGAVAWQLDRQAVKHTPDRETVQRVSELPSAPPVDDAAVALERGEAALRAGDAAAAGAALAEIDRRAPVAAPELALRVERLRTECALLEEFARIDAFRWSLRDGKCPSKAAAAEQWAKAFAAFGVVPDVPPAAARRVSTALARDHLLAVLDMWLVCAPSRGLVEVLVAADPDEFRAAVRAAVCAADGHGLRDLADRPAALGQPPRFAVPLAALDAIPVDRRRTVLKKAGAGGAKNLAVVMGLAEIYPSGDRGGALERVWLYQDAVAAHPRSAVAWNNLGDALRLSAPTPAEGAITGGLGEESGVRQRAIAAFREAVKLDPKYGVTYYNLALTLKDANNLSGAVENFRNAIANGLSSVQTYHDLGTALFLSDDLDGALDAFRTALDAEPNDATLAALEKVLAEQARRDRIAPPPRPATAKP